MLTRLDSGCWLGAYHVWILEVTKLDFDVLVVTSSDEYGGRESLYGTRNGDKISRAAQGCRWLT
jgi:hypothetical protein